MGRKLMRVPLDFNWPVKATWIGYLNPYRSIECPACGGSGLNPETKRLEDNWYTWSNHDGKEGWGHHLDQEDVDALWDRGRLRFDFSEKPSAKEVNQWSRHSFGHDALNQWICVTARAKRLGFYGKCELCKGDGVLFVTEDVKRLHEEWVDIEPPSGDGFQLWETTSEGSPVSPVFKTLDELCEWCAYNATTFASFKATKEQWLKMLSDGFVRHEEGTNVFV